MKSQFTTLALILAASASAFANSLTIKDIIWDAEMKDQLTVNASLLLPEGQTITTTEKSGFLVSDGQHPSYRLISDDEHSMSYTLSKSSTNEQQLDISILINKIPADGGIRIDDSISLKSYRGFESSPAHPLNINRGKSSFYFADYRYDVQLQSIKGTGFKLCIEAPDADPSLSCYRVLNAEGTQIAQLAAGQSSTTCTLADRPCGLVLVRRMDEQAIRIPIKQDIVLKKPYPDIIRKSMTLTIVPKPAPEQVLSEQEQALLKELRFFTMKRWSLSYAKDAKPQLELVYVSPEMKNNRFTLLTPELQQGCFPLRQSADDDTKGQGKHIGCYLHDGSKNQSIIIIQYREADDLELSWQSQGENAEEGEYVVQCTAAENLELDEHLDMRLAYGEENSKRQALQMNEGGSLYLDGHAYHYQVKPCDKAGMVCTIIVTSDKKDGIPPSLVFFDAQAKSLPIDSSAISTGQWEGEFATMPHAIQISKKVGILPLKAQLKINLPMPESF